MHISINTICVTSVFVFFSISGKGKGGENDVYLEVLFCYCLYLLSRDFGVFNVFFKSFCTK